MKKLNISLLLLVIMILSISVVSATDTDGLTDLTTAQDETADIVAVDEEVEPIGVDNEQGVVDSSNPAKSFTDLRKDIDNAGSELKLDSDYKYNATVDTAAENAVRYVDGVFINKNITIDGAGHTLDGSDVNRVFRVYGFTAVTLKNIIFINGKADVGSAVYSAGSLTYENCTFIDGGNVYDDASAVSSGSVYENTATSRYTVITDEDSYNAALADPASPLNRYYYAFNREDSIKADGTPAGAGDFVAGHSWEAAIKAPTNPERTSTLPWIVINLIGISGELVVEYDGEVKLTDYIAGPYSVMMYSVPNELGMEDYRLEWGTGNSGTETLDASKVDLVYTPYKSFTDLRAAIDATPTEGTLVLNDNYGYNPVADIAAENAVRYVDGIFINKNLTIDAAGHVIDASTVNRALIVYGFTTATIKNAVFINGKGSKGKAIYSAGTLTFENCTFIDGGNVYDDASAVSSGSVYENTATSRYTVITDEDSYNAALADPASPLNRYYYVSNREDGIDVDGNPVADSNTFIAGHSWEAAIKASTIPYRTSTLPWIAINLAGILKEDLVVEYEGEAVKVDYIEGPSNFMLYSVPNDLGMEDYRLEWGTGNHGTKTIDNSEVKVLFVEKAGSYTDLQKRIDETPVGGTLVLPYDFAYTPEVDDAFTGNWGYNFAYGMWIVKSINIVGNGHTISGENTHSIFAIDEDADGKPNVMISNATLANGRVSYDGGAIYQWVGTLNIDSVVFENNSAASRSAMGGAIMSRSNLTVTNSVFTNNTATNAGGAISIAANQYINGAWVYVTTNYNIDNCTFTDNRVNSAVPEGTAAGGAIYIIRDARGTISNSNFTRNKVSADKAPNGGAIKLQFVTTATVEKCNFTDNEAFNGGAVSVQGDYHQTSNVVIDDCNFIGNNATYGGAVAAKSNDECYTVVTLSNSEFEGNAATYGSAVYNNGNLSLQGNTINTTYAEIYNDGIIKSTVNATILENRTIDTTDSTYDLVAVVCDDNGNLIYDSSLQLTVNGTAQTTIVGYENYTVLGYALSGPGIYKVNMTSTKAAQALDAYIGIIRNIKGTYTDLQNQINEANAGAGLVMLSYDFAYNSEIDGEKFIDGVVINQSIAIFNFGNNIVIDGKNQARIFNITNNSIVMLGEDITLANGNATKGGAIYVDEGAVLIADKLEFINNTATETAGAIYADGDVNINYSLFVNNTASEVNGIYVSGNGIVTSLSNCNFTDDKFIYNEGSLIFENNKELTTKVDDSYSVYNAGYLTLDKNQLNTTIYNIGGEILSDVNVTLLDNTTVTAEIGQVVQLNATMVDDNGNAIYDPAFKFIVGENITDAIYNNLTRFYEAEYTTSAAGTFIVNVTNIKADKLNAKIGIIEVLKINTTLTVSVENIVYGQNATISVTLVDYKGNNLNGIVTVIINNKPYNITVSNGQGSINVSGLAAKDNYLANATFNGTGTYANSSATDLFKVTKAVPVINVTANDVAYPSDVVVTVTSDVAGDYVVKVGDKNQTVTLAVGVAQDVIFSGLAANEAGYVINVTYDATENYTAAFNDTVTVKVLKAVPVINVTAVDVAYPSDVVVTVTSDVAGDYVVKVGDKNQTVTLAAGVAQDVTFSGLAASDVAYGINVTFEGNENYTAGYNDTESVKVSKGTPVINVTVSDVTYPADVVVTVTGDVAGEYTVKVGNQTKTVTIAAGVAQDVTFSGLAVNETGYAIVVSVAESDNYTAGVNDTEIVKVSKGTPVITVTTADITYPDDAVVNITSDVDGTVLVKVGNETKEVTVTPGTTVSVTFSGLNASSTPYTVNATYVESENYTAVSDTSQTITVNKGDAEINVTSDATAGENSTITVNVPEDATGNVTVTIDGQNYTAPIENGTATVTGPVLTGGQDVEANVTYSGDNNYDRKTTTTTIHVKKVLVDASDMKRGWHSPYDYQAKLIDETGKPISGKEVTFTINGKQYTATTDDDGIAKLTTSKLAVGTYDVVITNPVTGENTTKELTVVARIIENKDLVKDYDSSEVFKVRAVGDNGKPIANVVVKLTVNGKTYEITTDKNGYASLPIRLMPTVPKTYTITSSYKGYTVKNTIKVKFTLKTKKTFKVKKTAKKLVLKAKLKWSSGKPIVGKKVTFKFKGKTYKAKTNKKGIAKVKVKKKVIKKLKKGKKYKVVVKYKYEKVKSKVKVVK